MSDQKMITAIAGTIAQTFETWRYLGKTIVSIKPFSENEDWASFRFAVVPHLPLTEPDAVPPSIVGILYVRRDFEYGILQINYPVKQISKIPLYSQ